MPGPRGASGSTGMAGRTGQAGRHNAVRYRRDGIRGAEDGIRLAGQPGVRRLAGKAGMESGEPFAGMAVILVNGITLCW